jgi:hypothetical protein
VPDFDIYNDTLPRRKNNVDRSPTVAQLKSALTTHNATSYTPERLRQMTENDLINAVRLHGLTVNTTLT